MASRLDVAMRGERERGKQKKSKREEEKKERAKRAYGQNGRVIREQKLGEGKSMRWRSFG